MYTTQVGLGGKEIPVLEGILPSPTAFLPLVTKKQPSEVLGSSHIMNRGFLVFWKPCWVQTELRVVASWFLWSLTCDQSCPGQPQTRRSSSGFVFLFCEGRKPSSHVYAPVLSLRWENRGNPPVYTDTTLWGRQTLHSHSPTQTGMWETLTLGSERSACCAWLWGLTSS